MDYQIVPARKVDALKQKKPTGKLKHSKHDSSPDQLNGVVTLQPTFKAPKSTLDAGTSIEQRIDKEMAYTINKASNFTHSDVGFNFFTMSRPGLHKSQDVTSLNTNHNKTNANQTTDTSRRKPSLSEFASKRQSTDPRLRRSSTQPTQLSNQETQPGPGESVLRRSSTQPTHLNRQTEHASGGYRNSQLKSAGRNRRASSGEELILNSSSAKSRNSSGKPSTRMLVGVISNVNLSGHKSLASSPRPSMTLTEQRGKSAGCRLVTNDNFKDLEDEELERQQRELAQRRKSLFDSHACSKWYSPERRPNSTETSDRAHRNVISPCTLARLSQTTDNQTDVDGGSVGSAVALSVCTEDDWKTYGAVFPNRKLVSHKKLIKASSLPYSDNIGLEEAVTSDQARVMAKSEQYAEWRKQFNQQTSKQTPKQVWYRTVRSVMAVNHLYHQVQSRDRNERVK